MATLLDNLASLAPQIMAGFGNRPETYDRVQGIQQGRMAQAQEAEKMRMQQEAEEAKMREKENLKRFGNAIMGMRAQGQQVTPEMAFKVAQDAGLSDPMQGLKMLTEFAAANKAISPEKQKFSMPLPGGQVNQFEALPDDPRAQMPGVMPGTISGTPERPQLVTGEGGFGVFQGGKLSPIETALKPRASSGTNVTVNASPSFAVNPQGEPVVPMKSAVETETQKDIVKGVDTLSRLDDIWDSFDPKWLTYQGKGQNWLSTMKEKAGFKTSPEEKAAITGMTNFKNSVNQMTNAYRKEITGAAASEQEIERLKNSLFNTEQSETEFKSAFKQFRDETSRALRIKQKLLREGIPVGSPMFGDQMDAAFLGGASANQPQDVNARGNEIANQLRTSGAPEAEIQNQVMQRLEYEGYIQ